MAKYNDIDIKQWKNYTDIETDSLWIIDKRDNSGAHLGDYHGNFVEKITSQKFLHFAVTVQKFQCKVFLILSGQKNCNL